MNPLAQCISPCWPAVTFSAFRGAQYAKLYFRVVDPLGDVIFLIISFCIFHLPSTTFFHLECNGLGILDITCIIFFLMFQAELLYIKGSTTRH